MHGWCLRSASWAGLRSRSWCWSLWQHWWSGSLCGGDARSRCDRALAGWRPTSDLRRDHVSGQRYGTGMAVPCKYLPRPRQGPNVGLHPCRAVDCIGRVGVGADPYADGATREYRVACRESAARVRDSGHLSHADSPPASCARCGRASDLRGGERMYIAYGQSYPVSPANVVSCVRTAPASRTDRPSPIRARSQAYLCGL